MAGLLDYASSVAGEAKKNVQGLLADPKQALMDILNNLTARAAASQAKTKAAWATRDPKIMAQNALDSSQTALGFAPLGITAWHGSPHKFDKFSLDKIGTGEGAQAYGHGLYLAESPDVAKSYQTTNVFRAFDIAPEAEKRGLQLSAGARGELIRQASANPDPMIAARRLQYANASTREIPQEKLADLIKGYQEAQSGSLYKTDLPDEAVARFLDWDKPLSQQAPEVQAAIEKMKKHVPGGMFSESLQPFERGNSTGSSLHRAFESDIASTGNGQASKTFSMLANEYGIPGIRYLDGGSRGAGQGSSNFVAFDPDLIRILERNGQATGNIPWQPGEWRGLLGNN